MRKLTLSILFLVGVAQAGLIPTPEEQVQVRITQALLSIKNSNVNQMKNVFQMIWNDQSKPTKFSPCTIWADMGNKAVSLLTASAQLAGLVNGLAPGSIDLTTPVGYTLTPNSDGTVSCIYVAPSPSPSPSHSPLVYPSPTPTPTPIESGDE